MQQQSQNGQVRHSRCQSFMCFHTPLCLSARGRQHSRHQLTLSHYFPMFLRHTFTSHTCSLRGQHMLINADYTKNIHHRVPEVLPGSCSLCLFKYIPRQGAHFHTHTLLPLKTRINILCTVIYMFFAYKINCIHRVQTKLLIQVKYKKFQVPYASKQTYSMHHQRQIFKA